MSSDFIKRRRKGIRWKLYVPTVAVIVVITIATVSFMLAFLTISDSYAIYTRLLAHISSFTDNDIRGSLPGRKITVYDPNIFDKNPRIDDKTLLFLQKADFLYGIFDYNPETDRFESVFDNLPDSEADMKYITGEGKDRLLEDGTFWTWDLTEVFPDYSWLYVRDPDPKPGENIRAVGVGIDLGTDYEYLLQYSVPLFSAIFLIDVAALIILYLSISKTMRQLGNAGQYIRKIDINNPPKEPLEINTGDELEEMACTINEIVSGLNERNQLEAELSGAAAIQNSMLPKNFPDSDRYFLHAIMDPARMVGGDFYDFFMLDKTHLVIDIADVSGKGVSAALYMTIGKTLIHNAAYMEETPAEVMSRINTALLLENMHSNFITAWLGVLDLDTGVLTYSNAGHNLPYVIGKKLRKLSEIHGTVLGVFPDLTYEQSEIKLEPGEVLYLYTDGVTECISADLSFYGSDRLEQVLADCRSLDPAAINSRVLSSLNDFSNGAVQSDDITMLSLMMKDPGGSDPYGQTTIKNTEDEENDHNETT